MRRRRYEDDSDPPDRWLVSYADFITLLFAFFVVLYAVSQQGAKYDNLSQSVKQAMGAKASERPSEGQPADAAPDKASQPTPPAPPAPGQTRAEAEPKQKPEPTPEPEMRPMADELAQRLSQTLNEGAAQVRQVPRGVTVEINAGILFDPAEARLNPAAQKALNSVAEVLRGYQGHTIQVLGHTDNIDIRSALYPSNWELSAARACTVVRLFAEAGLDEKLLQAIGRGATQPIASNDSAEGRLRNRRVEIQILAPGRT